MLHDLRQIFGRRFKQQMIIVVHQTEYMNNCIISFCSRFKIFKKLFPVTLALESLGVVFPAACGDKKETILWKIPRPFAAG
jgi:hypothetical protein